MNHLFRRDDEDPEEYQRLVEKWRALHDAELAEEADPRRPIPHLAERPLHARPRGGQLGPGTNSIQEGSEE